MSQEKVDKYKQEKANRKKTMAKEKRKKRLYVLCGAVIGIAFAVWIGFSVYNDFIKEQPTQATLSEEEYQQLLELLAGQTSSDGSTSGSDTSTTGSDSATTGTDENTTGTEEDTTGADEETTGDGETETTSGEVTE